MDANATITTRAIDELATAIGEDPANIRLSNPEWLKLMQKGVIVKLQIRRWRGKAKLDLTDLGLADQSESDLDELMSLGNKYLLPPKLIK